MNSHTTTKLAINGAKTESGDPRAVIELRRRATTGTTKMSAKATENRASGTEIVHKTVLASLRAAACSSELGCLGLSFAFAMRGRHAE